MEQDKEVVPGWTFTEPVKTTEKDTGWSYTVPAKDWEGSVGVMPKPEQKEKKLPPGRTTWKDFFKKTGKLAVGAGEGALTGISGAVAFPTSLAYGAYQLPFVGPKGVYEQVQKAREALTYQPTTKEGQIASEVPAAPFKPLAEAQQFFGNALPNKGGLREGWYLGTDLALLAAPIAKEITKAIPTRGKVAPAVAEKTIRQSPIRENGGKTSIVLKDGTALVGGRIHGETFNLATDRGFPEDSVANGVAAFTRDDGKTWDINGNSVKIKKIIDLDQPVSADLENPIEPGGVKGGSITPAGGELALPKYAANVNLERIGGDYTAKKLILDTADMIDPALKKRGVGVTQTWAETQEMADALNLPLEDLMNKVRQKTTNVNAYVLAARDTLMTSANEVIKSAVEYENNPTDANLSKYQYNAGRHAAIQLEVSSAASESGRVLNIHKKLSQAKDFLATRQWYKVAETLGKDISDPEVAKVIATMTPQETSRYLAQKKPATLRSKAFELWMNLILSNPSTHIVNMTSNLATEILSPIERAGGSAVDVIRHAIKPSQQKPSYMGEAAYQMLGDIRGVKEAIRRVAYAWKNGVTESGASKLEIPTKAIKGKKGEVIRTPSKLLMVEDEAMKGIIYTGELYAQAYRHATREGLRGPERTARITELVSKPTQAMSEAANQAALYKTFQKELGEFGKSLMHLRQKGKGAEFLFPFIRTPMNIAKYGLERTPLGMPRAVWGIEKGTIPREQYSRLLFTTTMTTAATIALADMVINGKVTGGGPTNTNEKQALYRTGWQPYSVKVGDKWYSYGRVEPLSTIMGTAADFWEVSGSMDSKTRAQVAAKIGMAVKNNLMNKTFLTGLANIMNAVDDPSRYGEDWLTSLATSTVPSVVAGVARATDPNLRDAQGIIDSFKSRIPGLSQTVPPRLTPTGEPVPRPGTPLSRMFSPVAVSKEINDPLWDELNRLKVFMGMPSPMVGGKKVAKEDIREIVQAGGAEMRKALTTAMASPMYPKLPDETKAKVLKGLITKYRNYGKMKWQKNK